MHVRRWMLGLSLLLAGALGGLLPGGLRAHGPRATSVETPRAYAPMAMTWVDPVVLADQVIALVNQERARIGCPALVKQAQLTRAAELHSRDMFNRDFFGHINPSGQGVLDRIQAQGYASWTEGENLAGGYRTAREVFQSWLASPEHATVLRNCDLEETGVGFVYESSDGGAVRHNYYWTQIFASPE